MRHPMKAILLASLALLSGHFGALPSSATTYTYTDDTVTPDPTADTFAGAGHHAFTISIDDVAQVLNFTITFQQNGAGLAANFWSFAITDGLMPGADETAIISFDNTSNLDSDFTVTGHVYTGVHNPIVDRYGALIFNTDNAGANPVIDASVHTAGDGSRTYGLSLDLALLNAFAGGPVYQGIVFNDFIGIWLQSMGLYPAAGTFVTYDGNGKIISLEADQGSPGSYGWYDTTDPRPTTVPEPMTALLLGSGALLGRVASRRLGKRA